MESQEETIFIWEKYDFDEDGQLWIITMFSIMIAPLYEEIMIKPLLLKQLPQQIFPEEFF
jgi:hypothetical protein